MSASDCVLHCTPVSRDFLCFVAFSLSSFCSLGLVWFDFAMSRPCIEDMLTEFCRDLNVMLDNMRVMVEKYRRLSVAARWTDDLRRQNYSELRYRKKYHPCSDCAFRVHGVSAPVDDLSVWLSSLTLDRGSDGGAPRATSAGVLDVNRMGE